ncbi:hypothetical protein ACMA5I_06260 [Paracoccaceae bacterium GXU_MW_L88]
MKTVTILVFCAALAGCGFVGGVAGTGLQVTGAAITTTGTVIGAATKTAPEMSEDQSR